jgi:hypothetical protein
LKGVDTDKADIVLGNLSTYSVLQVIERMRDLHSLLVADMVVDLQILHPPLHTPVEPPSTSALADAREACTIMLNASMGGNSEAFVQALSDVLQADICLNFDTSTLKIKCPEENLHRCALMSHGRTV